MRTVLALILAMPLAVFFSVAFEKVTAAPDIVGSGMAGVLGVALFHAFRRRLKQP